MKSIMVWKASTIRPTCDDVVVIIIVCRPA
jgi:hypothetical protein